MQDDTRLDELLLRWEENQRAGTPEPVSELCRDCPELLTELERRIADLRVADNLLEMTTASTSPPSGLATADSRSDPVIEATSRFRQPRFHARGGLGEIWISRDVELGREVAIKLIQEPHAREENSIHRFLREAEITGRLEHPGIVPVHSLGRTGDGRPCYTMRFIQGKTLAEAITEFHAHEATRTKQQRLRSLEFRELLQRFVGVCNTIAYAHSRGIIHRDLKPQNIMLGKYGETLVVDWGLARSINRRETLTPEMDDESTLAPTTVADEVTQLGQAVGTPAYMSPEQAAGRWDIIDAASDIYSLGATLYALLTGAPPFLRDEVGPLLFAVQQGDFVAPRHKNPDVPPALEAICLKAMARQPEMRYPSALDLARDIERWLADEAVSACRESVLVRAGRFARKRRTLVASAAILLLTTVGALAVIAILLDLSRRDLRAEQTRTSRARDKAQTNFELAKDAVDKFLNKVTAHPKLNEKDFFQLRKELLETAMPFYQKFVEEQGNDPEQEAARGRAYHRLALVRDAIGEKESALRDYEQMRDIFAKLAADFPGEPKYREALAGSHDNLGIILNDLAQRTASETAHRTALKILEQLAVDFPSEPAYQQNLAMSHNNLGVLLIGFGQQEKAETAYRAGLKVFERLVADFPRVPDYREGLAGSQNNLGALLVELGKAEEAEAAYRAALKTKQRLADDFPGEPSYRHALAMSHANLGNLVKRLGRRADAETCYRAALRIQEQLVIDFPSVQRYAMSLAGGYCNLGHLIRDQGVPQAALDWFIRAMRTLEPILEKEPRLVTARQFLRNAYWGRARAFDLLQQYTAAVLDWERAIELDDGTYKDQFQRSRTRSLVLVGLFQDQNWSILWGSLRF
jgi:eukaryotic-like serine/threonine-protein kinase